jgi:hypothetical protein
MTLKDLETKTLKVLGDRIAFQWLAPKTKSDIVIPENLMDRKFSVGRYFIGKVITVGRDVKDLLPGDCFVFNEYGVDSFTKYKSEDEVYFISRKEIKLQVEEVDRIYRDSKWIDKDVTIKDDAQAASDNVLDYKK